MKQIEKDYEDMLKTVQNMNVYDGRGTYDTYVCSNCGHELVTTYKDYGVTPFAIVCQSCHKGLMAHIETCKEAPADKIVHNWVRPTFEQFKQLAPGQKYHVMQGGLLLEDELKQL